jgi:ribose-phosphate pyrophosphokinase
MQHYAAKVIDECARLSQYTNGEPPLTGELLTTRFADGEIEVELKTSIRGKDVFLLVNCSRNPFGLSVEENLIELYHTIDLLKRSQPGKITLVEPYISSSRSDRTTRRNSVGFWVHCKILVSLGVNHIITYQIHSEKSKTIVDPTLCSIDDIPITSLLQRYLANTYIKKKNMQRYLAQDLSLPTNSAITRR